ncbi:MAG: hypothetical protein WC760_07525 [Bacteroidia bacterium]|jgi:hypothetical protein
MEKRLQKRLNDLEYTPSGSLWERIDRDLKTDFEKKLENKFNDYSVRNHPENWEKLESSLPSEKSGWNHFQTFAYAVTGVAILGLIYLFMPKQPFSETAEQNIPVTITAPPSDNVKNPLPLTALPEASKRSNQRTIESPPSTANSNTRRNAGTKTAIHRIAVKPTSAVTKNTTAALPVATAQKEEVNADENKNSLNPVSAEAPVVSGNLTTTSDKTSDPATDVVTIANTPAVQSPVAQVEQHNTVSPAQDKESAKSEAQVHQEIQPLKPEPSIINLATVTDSMHKIHPLDPNAIGTAGLNDPDKLTEFSIRVIAGAYICLNRLETPGSSSLSFEKNKALRNSLESPGIDWSGLFLLDYRINERWNISGGMGILNFSQSFYFNTVAPVATTGSAEKGAQIIHPNDSIISGNNYSTRIKYSWTEIPVFVRYRITNQPRFNLVLEGGLSYAIISTTDAGMVSYDNVGVLLIKDKEAFPGIQNNWFATFAPALTYKLNNEVTLGLMPSAKFALNSMVANKDWMQQYPYFVGLNATLTKRF